jgi:hypothetical protein
MRERERETHTLRHIQTERKREKHTHTHKPPMYIVIYTVVPPYPQAMHLKTPSGCLKPQIVLNFMYTMVFPKRTYL